MSHAINDRISLELAKRVAAELRERPEWLELAKGNLARWKQRNADSPGLVRFYEAWERILERPVEEICAFLVEDSGHAQQLRQGSPFVGAIDFREVWAIKNRIREEARREAARA